MTKRMTNFLLLAIILGATTCSISYAQRRGNINAIGMVDLRAVVMLHPSMADYNAYERAFRVDRTKTSEHLLKSQTEAQKKEITRMKADVKRLQAKLAELKSNFDRRMDSMSTKYGDKAHSLTEPGALEVATIEYEMEKQDIETKYLANSRHTSNRLAMLSGRLELQTRLSKLEGYTQPDETHKKISAIVAEVMQHVKAVSDKNSISVVLNSGQRKIIEAINAPSKRERGPMGLVYRGIVFAPFTPIDEVERPYFKDSDHINGYYQNITHSARLWLSYDRIVLKGREPNLLSADILMGGIDLTGEVVKSLFRQYKINEHIGNAIIEALYPQ